MKNEKKGIKKQYFITLPVDLKWLNFFEKINQWYEYLYVLNPKNKRYFLLCYSKKRLTFYNRFVFGSAGAGHSWVELLRLCITSLWFYQFFYFYSKYFIQIQDLLLKILFLYKFYCFIFFLNSTWFYYSNTKCYL